MSIINIRSLSEEEVRKDLERHVSKLPDSWKDFYSASTGQSILEMIAALGAFSSYHKTVTRLESNIETAVTEQAVLELAADKGVMISPSNSGKLLLTVRFHSKTTVVRGNMVGSLSDYELYSLETFTVEEGQDYTFPVLIGHLNSIVENISGFGNFDTHRFLLKDKYASRDFESLIIDTDSVSLVSELGHSTEIENTFNLRACYPGEIRIYSGNGILGYANPVASTLRYNVISYGIDVEAKMNAPVSIVLNGSLLSKTTLSAPEYYMTIDQLKGYTRYSSVDGRIVTDTDYKTSLIRHFGGSIEDCYTYNSDPNQEVYLILKDEATEANIEEMRKMLDSKRGLNIRVNMYITKKEDGLVFSCSLTVPTVNFYSDLMLDINKYLETRYFRFFYNRMDYTSSDLASELSAYFGFPFKSPELSSISIKSMQFFRKIEVEIIPKD